jgi:hypothetical protein
MDRLLAFHLFLITNLILISGKTIPTDNSFSISKKTVKRNKFKCLSENESITNNNSLAVLDESILDFNVSIDEATEKFISACQLQKISI